MSNSSQSELVIHGRFSPAKKDELRKVFALRNVVFSCDGDDSEIPQSGTVISDWQGNPCQIGDEVFLAAPNRTSNDAFGGMQCVLIGGRGRPIGKHPDSASMSVVHDIRSKTATFCGVETSRLIRIGTLKPD